MNLEDIFITIVDTTDAPQRRERVKRTKTGGRSSIENEYARSIMEKTAAAKQSSLKSNDEESEGK